MGCVDLGSASAGSGCAGDFGPCQMVGTLAHAKWLALWPMPNGWQCRDIVKHSRRGNRASQANPKGRVYKVLGVASRRLRCSSIAARHLPSPRPCKRGAIRDELPKQALRNKAFIPFPLLLRFRCAPSAVLAATAPVCGCPRRSSSRHSVPDNTRCPPTGRNRRPPDRRH